MHNYNNKIRDGIFTFCVLGSATALNMILSHVFHTQTLISDIFIFGVFIISLQTQGYLWGMIASFLSVLAVNFAFTFPYYAFDFQVIESLSAAVIMLVVGFTTSTLTTKIKQHERTKAESEKESMRANLLRAISHDLRTPLTTIYGSCSAVIENYDSLNKEQQIKLLKEIREDSEWLIRMVENLLSVTRIGGEKIRLVKSSTVLEELMDAVWIKFVKQYPDIVVRLELPDEFISIPMDAMLIEQVLMNLMENAVFHAKGMSELLLKVEVTDNKAIFEVTDDGCGISAENLQTLFSGNVGVSNMPSDSNRKGMGIGLSVCATIIRAHGGKIWANNGKAKGVSFYFTLDIEERDDEQ